MYLIGYQMPASPIFDMAALMAETDLYLYDTPNRSFWGDDMIRLTLSNIYNFKISPRVSFTAILQLTTGRQFRNFPRLPEDLPSAEKDALFYQDRELNTDSPLKLNFSKAAAIVTVKL
jgi:hypothetical protein